MKDQKLTAADLALYLWNEARIAWKSPAAEEAGVWISPVGSCVFINAPAIAAHDSGDVVFQPILRPLSEMREEEARDIFKIYYSGLEWEENDSCLETWVRRYNERVLPLYHEIIGYPKIWRYLLSKGFDLFGWIDAGLAIDKTKVNENAVNP